MLRTFILTVLLWLASSLLNAQAQTPAVASGIEAHLPRKAGLASKGTALQERLVGSSFYNTATSGSPPKIADSAHYIYNTFSRGSELDNRIPASYVDLTSEGMSLALRPYPVIATHDFTWIANKVTIKYDSAYYCVYHTDGPLFKETHLSRIYNSGLLTRQNKQEIVHLPVTTTPSTDQYLYDYDTAQRLASAHYLPGNPAMTDGHAMYRIYNNRHVIKDSIPFSWPGHTDYIYDSSNKIVQLLTYKAMIPPRLTQRETYTYDSNGLLHTRLLEVYMSNRMHMASIDTFGYQGGNVIYNSTYRNWDDTAGRWTENGVILRSYYNASNNIDSQLSESTNASSTVPLSKTYYTYTTHNHFDQIKHYRYIGTGYSVRPDMVRNFYYELYDPTDVAAVNKKAALNVSIYPNPVKNVLYLSFNRQLQQPVHIAIYNASGQIVRSTLIQQSKYLLAVQDLTAGTYIIATTGGENRQQIKFIKD